MGKLVTNVTAFRADDGTLFDSYSEAALYAATERIAYLIKKTENVEIGYNEAATLARILQDNKVEFREILGDL